MVAELIVLFLETSKELVQNIRTSIKSRDLEKLSNSAHSLKSSAGTLGAKKLSETCHQLEVLGEGRLPLNDLDQLSEQFEQRLLEATRALEKYK